MICGTIHEYDMGALMPNAGDDLQLTKSPEGDDKTLDE